MGYGTQTPSSIAGKAIGGVCAIVGVFILTLPVPIVVNSFASYYKNRLWRNEVAHKRRLRAAEQTRLVKEILISNSRRPSACGSHVSLEDAQEAERLTTIPEAENGSRPSSAMSCEERRNAFASLASFSKSIGGNKKGKDDRSASPEVTVAAAIDARAPSKFLNVPKIVEGGLSEASDDKDRGNT